MYIKEVAASLYPWDLADEGVDRCIDNVTGLASANSLYLIGVMHWEKRPLTGSFYPHNPVRKFYIPENSRIYYRVSDKAFDGMLLKPVKSERDFLNGTDWLDTLSGAARKRNLKMGVELSHTIYDTAKAQKENPQILQKHLDGTPVGGGSYLCLNNPHVRQYITTLFAETVRNHDVDFIQTCLLLFESAGAASINSRYTSGLERMMHTVNGGCFCQECRHKALSKGYDWDLILHDAGRLSTLVNAEIGEARMDKDLLLASGLSSAGLLLEFPGVYQWMAFRMESIKEILTEIYNAVKAADSKVEVRLNHCFEYQEFMGLRHGDLKDCVDSVRDSDYSEQTGNPDRLIVKQRQIAKIRRGVGFDKPVLASIGIRPNATPEIIRESIRRAANLGIDGLSLGHYDGASIANLKAVTQGMQEAEMEILP
ncbi:MAG: hypothetical protein LBV27_01205 [Oscillospiraceae bacterium]|jgi:hypothetical protein|nr:hypothetical protein [Oscillospiraceae bacterium]